MAWELLVGAGEIEFPDQGLNRGSLHWNRRVLAIGTRQVLFFIFFSIKVCHRNNFVILMEDM